MGESKNFIKNAVGLLIVVAICFLAVMIYKKGNDSISNSMEDYDELLTQLGDAEFTQFDNASASGTQVAALIRALDEQDGLTIRVRNGYSINNNCEAQVYTFQTVFSTTSTVLMDIKDKTKKEQYINPTSTFNSEVVYNDNDVVSVIVFTQK